MEKKIAECAERISTVLKETGGVNVLRLAENLGERSVIVYQALGWLAREGRVRYEQRGTQVLVSGQSPAKAAPIYGDFT